MIGWQPTNWHGGRYRHVNTTATQKYTTSPCITPQLFAVAHLSRFWVHAVRPEVGDIVRVIPNHVCVVVNMVDQLIAIRGGEIVEVLPVAARGKLV